MWGGWVDELARPARGSRPGSRSATACSRSWASIPATGLVRWHGLLAATPMARIREAVEAYVAARPAPGRRGRRRGRRRPGTPPTRSRSPSRSRTSARSWDGSDSGCRLFAVATSDDRDPTERTLEALGHRARRSRPSPAPTTASPTSRPPIRCCRSVRVSGSTPARTAVVGDSPADLRMGRAAGVGPRHRGAHRRRRRGDARRRWPTSS